MPLVELTDEEANIIARDRAQRQAAADKRERAVHVLATAALYLEWLNKNGMHSTYSTFCDGFQYPEVSDRKTVFGLVTRVIEALL